MVGGAEVLAVVPARGGSKSIPRKNIRHFGGHPLLAYSIAAGLQAETVDRVIVSTDDEEVAEIAQRYGAEIPFLRPSALAQDDTPDLPVFEHALNWLAREEAYEPEVIVQLRPTSPIRPPDCVDGAVRLLLENDEADSVRGVVPSGQNPYKMWRLEDGRLRPLMADPPEAYNMPRQMLPATYWQTGHIDAIRAATIREKASMTGDVILPWILDPGYTLDIDSPRDWARAEALLRDGQLDYVRPGRMPRPLPDQIDLVILDFDGVMTDNRVWLDGEGREWVAANRSDGWGLARLQELGIEVVIISTEKDPVVAARGGKLGLEVLQGVEDKRAAVRQVLEQRGIDSGRTIFVANDVNDLAAFAEVACALVVADAHPDARTEADVVLQSRGGFGAVREVCDMLIRRREREAHD